MVAPTTTRARRADTVVRFVLDFVPVSAKNGQRILRRAGRGRCRCCGQTIGGVPFVVMGEQAELDQRAIHRVCDEFVQGDGTSFFGDDDVGVQLLLDERAKRLEVLVESLGPKPRSGPTDRVRDIHNLFDLVMDGMQRRVFDNDRQTRTVSARYGAVERAEQGDLGL